MKKLELVTAVLLGALLMNIFTVLTRSNLIESVLSSISTKLSKKEIKQIPIICKTYNNKQKFKLLHYKRTTEGMLDLESGQFFHTIKCDVMRTQKPIAYHHDAGKGLMGGTYVN